MDESLRATPEGAAAVAPGGGRATGLAVRPFTPLCLFDPIPAYQDLKDKGLTDDELIEALRGPEVRESIDR